MKIITFKSLKLTIVTASIVVASIGVMRELYIVALGTDTALRELGPLALDNENTLPSWYSSTLLFLNALLLAITASSSRHAKEKAAKYWAFLAVIFVGLSIDEGASFHEKMGRVMHSILDLSGVFHFAWVIPAGIMVLLFVLAYIPFLLSLPKNTAIGMISAGAIYIFGAIGFEMIGSLIVSSAGIYTVEYAIAATIEEITEIAGMTLFFVVLCKNLSQSYAVTTLSVSGNGP